MTVSEYPGFVCVVFSSWFLEAFFILMYKVSVIFWKKWAGVNNGSQMDGFLEASQVVFTLVSPLAVWISPNLAQLRN